MEKNQIEPIYGFMFENIKMGNVKEVTDGNIFNFESKDKLFSFITTNNFIIHHAGDTLLIVTKEKSPRIYGRVLNT